MKKVVVTFVFIFLIFVLLISFISSVSALKYVRQGASGSGSGNDWTNAYTVLPDPLIRGETYYIADGTYSSYIARTIESGNLYITIKKATISDHGTSTGWSACGNYAGDCGDGQAVFGTITIMTDNWIFDGQVGGGPGSWTSGHGFKVNGNIAVNPTWNEVHTWEDGRGDNVVIKHIEIDGTGTSGTTPAIMFSFASGLNASYLYTHHSAECFVNSLNADNGIFEYNFVGEFCTDCSPAIHGEIFSWKYNGDLTARYNIFTWVESTGGIMVANTGADKVDIYGNVFYRPSGVTWTYGGDGVVGGWVGRTDLGVYNMNVYQNTFINIPSSALSPLGITPGNNRNVKNNYFYASSTGLPSGDWSHDYNHYQNSGTEQEQQGTQGSGDPFSTLDWNNIDFAKLNANTVAGDSSLLAKYRTDWFGNVGTTRGALQYGGVPPVQYTLTVNKDDNGGISASGLTCNGNICTGNYYSGTNVLITATPNSGYRIDWNDVACTDYINTCTINIVANKIMNVGFQLIPLSVPVISEHPSNQQSYVGSTAIFNVIATGNPSPNYQWQRSTNGGASWGVVGGNSATLSLSSLDSSYNNNLFRVNVSNSFGSQMSNVATLTVTTAPPVPINGLVAYWNFDGTGSSNAVDSINGNVLTLTNGATRTLSGKINSAASLDGTNDYLSSPNSASLDLNGNAMSISAWVNISNTNTYQQIIAKPFTSYASPFFAWHVLGLSASATTWTPAIQLANSGGASGEFIASSSNVNYGQWVHLIGVYDGSSITIYVNGVNAGSIPQSGNIASYATNLLVGSDQRLPGEVMKGYIDELRIYNRALSPSEVNTLYLYDGSGATTFNYHPADNNPQNKIIEYNEVSSYVTGYLTGSNDLKNALYVITLRQSGGNYNDTATTSGCSASPWNCWVNV